MERLQALQQVRTDFVRALCNGLEQICSAALEALTPSLDDAAEHGHSPTQFEQAREEFETSSADWVLSTQASWRELLSKDEMMQSRFSVSQLQIEDPLAVDHRLLASRLGNFLKEEATSAFADLRMRILHLERSPELSSHDVFQPSVLALPLVQAWSEAGLSLDTWDLCSDAIQTAFSPFLTRAYERANEQLVAAGVLTVIDQRALLRRSSSRVGTPRSMAMGHSWNGLQAAAPDPSEARLTLAQQASMLRHGPAQSQGGRAAALGLGATPHGDSQLHTHAQAKEVTNQLTNLLQEQAGFVPTGIDAPQTHVHAQGSGTATVLGVHRLELIIPPDASPAQALALIKDHSAALKNKASTKLEKASIEIVALMFQNILAEERIADSIRLLFARLQIPLVRIALHEPHFFESLKHPARKLLDRMGACVLGLDPSSIARSNLEAEIRRIVTVVEHYPDTGNKIYSAVLEEFEAFLKQHLSGSEASQKMQGIAQQLEHKETLTVQYTIEIRNLIQDFVVSDVIRNFLLKVWSEVLATTAVRHGRDSAKCLAYKSIVSELVWAGSPKPARADRMHMIAQMPSLLATLREGMTVLTLAHEAVEEHIRELGQAFAQAFQTKTQAIEPARLKEMSLRLQNLEELFTEENLGDLPIDAESIELMLNMDAQALHVFTDQPVTPSDAATQWAHELELGRWFSFTSPGGNTQVQYAWHSDLRQLHLFANASGKNYLFQVLSLAAYLQSGQLAPVEQEALTVRATRQALDRLNANPAQLLE
jgi:Protein of unknown function (DUF1631)